MNKGKWLWVKGVLSAFASAGCFITIDTWFADQHHLNTACIIVGIALAGVAALFIYKAYNIQDY